MKTQDLNTVLLCAFRYALGRSSYIVSSIAEAIYNHKDELERRTIEIMLKEIKCALETDRAGMYMDKTIWEWLAEELKKKLNS